MNKIQLFTYDISLYDGEFDMSYFSDSLAEHINRYKLAKDQLRSYCLYRLLRFAIKKDFLSVEFQPTGCPILPDEEFFISLSHSGNIVAVAISQKKLSIDLEVVSERVLQLNCEKWLTTAEQSLYKSLPPKKQIRYLTKVWTEKECYVKYDGRGIKAMFGNGAIDFAKLPIKFNFTPKFVTDAYSNKYCLTVCTEDNVRVVSKRIKEI